MDQEDKALEWQNRWDLIGVIGGLGAMLVVVLLWLFL